MRVALDAAPLTLSSGGLARYTSELSQALEREFPEDEYTLISDQPFAARNPHVQIRQEMARPANALERRWWLWGVQRAMDRIGANLFHGTNFTVPFLPLRPSVLTLHDLSPWMDGAWHSGAASVRRRTPLFLKMGIATMVLTDTEAVRRQAIDYFRIEPDRVVAIPLAAPEWLVPLPKVPGDPYFLYIGTLEPRKNLHMLINAWRPVHRETGIGLTLAGRRRADFPEIAPEPGLRLAGEVSERELASLYSNAVAFVYPSLYEGFGLPVLEAMHCGTCVITATDAAIREVAGDAAVLLDARDSRAWSNAMRACASGGEWLQRRRQQSLARAADFSWASTAQLTRDVYVEARERFER